MCFISVGRKHKWKVNLNEHYCATHFTLKSNTTTESIHRYAEMLWSLGGWFVSCDQSTCEKLVLILLQQVTHQLLDPQGQEILNE